MQEKNISENHSNGYWTKWQKPFKNKIIIASIILGVIYIASGFYSCSSDKCQTIYDIMRELKPDMSREEVLSIIEKHDKPYVVKSYKLSKEYASPEEVKGGYISIWVFYASIHCLRLNIWFHDNKLYMAKIRGENGPYQIKGAPPDILKKDK